MINRKQNRENVCRDSRQVGGRQRADMTKQNFQLVGRLALVIAYSAALKLRNLQCKRIFLP